MAEIHQETHSERLKRYILERDPKIEKRLIQDSAKRFKYLLGLTDLFRHFIDLRAVKDKTLSKILEDIGKPPSNNQSNGNSKRRTRNSKSGSNGNPDSKSSRRRKTEKEEDAELIIDEDDNFETTIITESPSCK